jgi:hypothetical protein
VCNSVGSQIFFCKSVKIAMLGVMLRYTQSNKLAFQVRDTEAVVGLHLSPDLELSDEVWKIIKTLSPLNPVPCRVELGEYDMAQCCFSCHGISDINTSVLCYKQKTTQYKQFDA